LSLQFSEIANLKRLKKLERDTKKTLTKTAIIHFFFLSFQQSISLSLSCQLCNLVLPHNLFLLISLSHTPPHHHHHTLRSQVPPSLSDNSTLFFISYSYHYVMYNLWSQVHVFLIQYCDYWSGLATDFGNIDGFFLFWLFILWSLLWCLLIYFFLLHILLDHLILMLVSFLWFHYAMHLLWFAFYFC
jgi:hypothetical protein